MNIQHPAITLVISAALTLCTPHVLAVTESAVADITNAAYAGDTQQLRDIAQTSEGYDRAYALYRVAQLGFAAPNAQLKPALEQAATLLQGQHDAESKTLLAAVYTLSMGLEPHRAKQLAPITMQLIADAKTDPKARPRALLIEGINRFYTPAAYGGGAEAALTPLTEAATLFADAGTETDVEPVRWGESETQVALGQVYAALGQPHQARAHFQRALAMDPACVWAKHYLENL